MRVEMLQYPNINPVAISAGPFAIYWYAIAYLVGIYGGWFYGKKLNNISKCMRNESYDDIVSYIALGVIIGGRLGNVLFYDFSYYAQYPAEVVKIWNGGMSFHGGFIGVALSLLLFARIKTCNVWQIFDVVACCAPIGLFFGRIANFVNGELYGRATDASWGMIFPRDSYGLVRHPSQLYEAFFEGVMLFIILNYLFFKKKSYVHIGKLSSCFVIFYSIFRFFVEYFREPDAHIGYVFNCFTRGQVFSIIMLCFGVFLYARIEAKRI